MNAREKIKSIYIRERSKVYALPFNGVMNDIYDFYRKLGPEIVFDSTEFDLQFAELPVKINEFSYTHQDLFNSGLLVCDKVHVNRAGSELISDYMVEVLAPLVRDEIKKKKGTTIRKTASAER